MIDAGQVIAYIDLDASKFNASIKGVIASFKDLSNRALPASTRIKGLGESLQGLGRQASIASAAIAAVGTAAVVSFTKYDDAIRQVWATMDASMEERRALDELARSSALGSTQTIGQVATAMDALAAAGYDVAKSQTALPTVMLAAQAGNLDMARATDILTGSMTALGVEIDKMPEYADQISGAAQSSNASIAEMGDAILAVGAYGKQLAGGTVELTTGLGVLADVMIKGSEGGTALRNILRALASPDDGAAKALKALKVSAYDATTGALRPLNETLGDLDAALATLSAEDRASTMSKIFNAYDLAAAGALMESTKGRWQELSAEIAGSEGSMQKMADTMQGGLGGATRELMANISVLGVEFGESLAPTVEMVADRVGELAAWFAELPEDVQSSIVNVALFVAAIGPVLIVGGKVISMFGVLAGLMSGPVGWVALGVAGVALLATGMEALSRQSDETGNAINRAFARLDKDSIEDRKRSIEREVEAQTNIKVSTKITSGQTVESQLDDFYKPLIDKLAEGGTVTDEDAERVNTGVNATVDKLIAAVNVDTSTKLAGLNADLEAGLISEEDYKARCDALLAQAEASKTALEGVRTSSETLVTGLVGDASASADDAGAKFDALKDSASGAVTYINGLDGMLTVGSLFQTIQDKLTDGKPDSKEQTNGLLQQVQDTFGPMIADVEKWVNDEIAKLDVTSADYDTQVANIQARGKEMTGELNALQAAASKFITEQSGKSTKAVSKNLDKLNEIEARALAVTAAINEATQADAEAQKTGNTLVKAGATRDAGTIDKALSGAYVDYKLELDQAKQDYETALAELQQQHEEGKISTSDYKEKEGKLKGDLKSEQDALLEAYRVEMGKLLAGVADAYPELQEQLKAPFEKLDMADAMETLIAQINSGEVDKSAVTDALAKQLGMEPDQLYKQIEQGLTTGDTSGVINQLTQERDTLRIEAADLFSAENLDFGDVGTAFMGALEAGLFGPFSDLDLSDGETLLNAMLGKLGQKPRKTEVEIEPEPVVVEPSGGPDVAGQAREQVAEQIEGQSEPVAAQVPVEAEPVLTEPEGGMNMAEQAKEQVAEQIEQQPEPVKAEVPVEAVAVPVEPQGGAPDLTGDMVQQLIDKITAGETERGDITDEIAGALGIDGDALYAKIQQGLTLGDTSGITNELVGLRDQLVDQAQQAGSEVGASLPEGAAAGITENDDQVADAAKTMMGDAVTAAEEKVDAHSPSEVFRTIGRGLPDGAALGVNDNASSVASAVASMASSATGELSGMATDGKTAGGDAIQGLINGAETKRVSLISKFKSLAKAAIQAAKNELGIASPSTVFTAIGSNLVTSMADSIERNRHIVEGSMMRLAALSPSTITGAGSTYQSTSSVTNNYNDAPITVTLPGATVRSEGDIIDIQRRTQRVIRDIKYGVGVRRK